MILFPVSSVAPPEEVRGWMLTNPFSLAFHAGVAAAEPPVTNLRPRTQTTTNLVVKVD